MDAGGRNPLGLLATGVIIGMDRMESYMRRTSSIEKT